MKTTNDWKDALSALLPDGEAIEESTPTESAQKEQKQMPRLKVEIDKKRAGKTATIISGFDVDDPRVEQVAADLKKALAVGGSARGGEILLQGDRKDKAISLLRNLGYKI